MRFKSGVPTGELPASYLAGLVDEYLAADRGTPDACRGRYLCDVCEELMTDDILPAAESPSGLDLAICAPCRVKLRPR